MQSEPWTDDNNRTTRVVDTLTQQVLPKSTILPFSISLNERKGRLLGPEMSFQ